MEPAGEVYGSWEIQEKIVMQKLLFQRAAQFDGHSFQSGMT